MGSEIGHDNDAVQYCIWLVDQVLIKGSRRGEDRPNEYLALEIRFDDKCKVFQHLDCYQEAVKKAVKSTIARMIRDKAVDIGIELKELGNVLSLKNCRLRYVRI